MVRESIHRMLLTAAAGWLLSTSPLSALGAPAGFNGYFAGMSKAQAEQAGVENCRNGASTSEDSTSLYCDIPAANRQLSGFIPRRATLEFGGPKHDALNQIRLEFVKPVESIKSAMFAMYGEPRFDGQTYLWEQGAQTVSLNILSRLNAISCVTFDHEFSADKARVNALRLEALRKQVVKSY
jgi:hypothetical protein